MPNERHKHEAWPDRPASLFPRATRGHAVHPRFARFEITAGQRPIAGSITRSAPNDEQSIADRLQHDGDRQQIAIGHVAARTAIARPVVGDVHRAAKVTIRVGMSGHFFFVAAIKNDRSTSALSGVVEVSDNTSP